MKLKKTLTLSILMLILCFLFMPMTAFAEGGFIIKDGTLTKYVASILATHVLGIVNGKSKTTFDLEGTITRQMVAAMLSRTAKILGAEAGSGEVFRDSQKFSSWAGEYIDFVSGFVDPVSKKKVMSETSDGSFKPLAACTKEQAIVIALRLYHCVM